jgi:hypothetical protein
MLSVEFCICYSECQVFLLLCVVSRFHIDYDECNYE